MANDNNIKKFTAIDIEKYHKGLLSPKEMHDLEKAALEDPFLADALEGYAVTGVNAEADIAELKKRLAEKTGQAKVIPLSGGNKNNIPWLRAAAMVVLLAGAAVLAYVFVFDKKSDEIAKADPAKTEQVKKADSVVMPVTVDKTATAPVATNTGEQTQPTAATKNDTKIPAHTTGETSSDIASASGKASTDLNKPTGEEPAIVPGENVVRTESMKEKKSEAEEEVKARTAAAAKKDTDKNLAAISATQENNEQKVNRAVTMNRQAADQYRNTNIFRGRVTDASNTGVPFANVTNVEDNVGTYADAKGYFNLTSPDTLLNVQVRSIGFENSNIQLRNNVPTNQVVMQDDRRSLSEVVISNQKPNAAARSQNNNVKLEEPEPADGWDNYDAYLANNLNMPEDFKSKESNTAMVQVSFEVDRNGEPINIRVEKSLCKKCDKEAIRLIKEGPKWKRNAKNGRTTVTIPFNQLFH